MKIKSVEDNRIKDKYWRYIDSTMDYVDLVPLATQLGMPCENTHTYDIMFDSQGKRKMKFTHNDDLLAMLKTMNQNGFCKKKNGV